MADDIGFGNRPLPNLKPGEPQRSKDTGRPGTAFYPHSPSDREKAVAKQGEVGTKSTSPRVS